MSMIIPDELIYASPVKSLGADANYVEYSPVSGTTFNANDNIRINISSSTHFLDLQKSYLSFDLYITDTSGSSGTVAGGSGCIYRVSESLGGLQISDLQNYGVMCKLANDTATSTRQNALKCLEGFGADTSFSYTDGVPTTGRRVCHSLKTPLHQIKQLLPLPYASLSLDIQLDSLNNFVKNASATAFTLKNVRYKGFLVKVDNEYLQKVQDAFSQGSTMKIPFQNIRSYNLKPSAVSRQSFIVNTGVADSIRSWLMCQRESTAINSNTTDALALFSNNYLSWYYTNVNGSRYPANFYVNTNTVKTDTQNPLSVENLMHLMCSYDNDASFVNYVSPINTTNNNQVNTNQFYFYNLAVNRSFGSGVSSRDGLLEIAVEYSTVPDSTESISIFVAVDGVIEISNSSVYSRFTSL